MSAKQIIKNTLGAIGRLPGIVTLLNVSVAKRVINRLPGGQLLYQPGWDRIHPFDRFYNIETSGYVGVDALPQATASKRHAVFYAGSQPGVLRQALRRLPRMDDYTFIDLGCGKGRALIVASEFPFKRIVGVELNPDLAALAQHNADVVGKRYPDRPTIQVVAGDATAHPFPAGNIALFMYHPFHAELVAKVVAGLEAALTREQRRIVVIYYNPVAASCFDDSTVFHRRFAGMIPYATDEVGFGPDTSDPLAIWEAGPHATLEAQPHAKIEVSECNMRVAIHAA